ncbi:MAG: hypothetical protein NC421_04980 [Lachnospiraceae bacterium]|nr:hypothetical protein [Lachnospiraceae bacterium]
MRAAITIFLLSLLAACLDGRSGNTLLLEHIDSLTSVNPAEVAALLDSIDPATLSEEERHHRDLLTIKAADKAYITHTSDSLILSVIDYYNAHSDPRLTPQALYYGGRVYSDLGDYPTALRYFQDALNRLPDNNENRQFRGTVMSQTGRLLNQINLYSQAIPYIKESIDIDRQLSDTFGLAYDNKLLGAIHYHLGDYGTATDYFREAIKYASTISATDSANMAIYLADIQQETGNIDSALCLIRNLPDLVSPLSRNRALSSAALIYQSAGILDTAYMYAHELAKSERLNNRKVGYKVMLSPDLREFVNSDSLRIYINEYSGILDSLIYSSESNEALIQNSYYNYQKHVEESNEAKESKDSMILLLIILTGLILTLLIVLIYVRHNSSKRLLKLYRAMDLIDQLRAQRNTKPSQGTDMEPEESSKLKIMKEQLLLKIQNLDDSNQHEVPEEILQSEVYNKIHELISAQKGITSDSLWEDLAKVVELVSPGFEEKLIALTEGRISNSDLQIVLLIKCEIPPKAMATLLNKAKGSIYSRRKYLGNKIFNKDIAITEIDNLIRSL